MDSPSTSEREIMPTWKANIEEHCFTWKVDVDVLNEHRSSDEALKSPIYLAGSEYECPWQISAFRNRRLHYVATIANVESGESNKKVGPTKVAAQISFLENRFQEEASYHSKSLTWANFNYKMEAHAYCTPMQCGAVKELSIFCRVYLKTFKNNPSPTLSKKDPPTELRLLGQDMSRLQTVDFTDAVLRTTTKDFRIHKAWFAVRSPVFGAMFSSDMVEGREGIVDFGDIDDDVVTAFIEYVNTGSIKSMNGSSSEDYLELMGLADKYDIPGLKQICEKQLSLLLNLDNAAEIFLVANLHGAKMLKNAAIAFLQGNKKLLLKSDEFRSIMESYCDAFLELGEDFSG